MDPILIAVLVVVVLGGALFVAYRTRSLPLTETARGRDGLAGRIARVLAAGLGDSTWEAIEEELLAADIGVEPARRIVAGVRDSHAADAGQAKERLAEALEAEFAGVDRALRLFGAPAVILVVGVNGTGKTTTIAKLASRLGSGGRSILLAAADTFRAAAGEQLEEWGDRLGVPVVRGQEGADPASVAFDAISSAKARGIDVVIVDTAGRLQSKKNLMAELEKIHRVASSAATVDEVLLVLDATTGQNGLAQVEVFADAIPVTGVVLAKLDGTARGGIVVTVESSLGVPVKLVGVGEGVDDLEEFEPRRFARDLIAP